MFVMHTCWPPWPPTAEPRTGSQRRLDFVMHLFFSKVLAQAESVQFLLLEFDPL